MKLTRLLVRRLPGIDQGFRLENIAEGINLIVGPNGSGKTSICRLIRNMLWPSKRREQVDAIAHWIDGEEQLTSEFIGQVRWQREGEDTPSPELPDRHLAGCFTIGLTDLLDEKRETEKRLASEVRQLLAGGYDVEAVGEEYSKSNRFGQTAFKEVVESKRVLREIENDRRSLAENEDRLQSLEEQRARAEAAGREKEKLQHAAEFAGFREDLDSIEAEMATYPEGMDQLGGEEGERLAELMREREETEQSLGKREKEKSDAAEALAALDLPGGAVDEERLESMGERARALTRTEEKLADAVLNESSAATELENREAELGVPPDRTIESIDDGDLESLENWVFRSGLLREQMQSNEAAQNAFEDDNDPGFAPLDALRESIARHQDWLAAPAPVMSRGLAIGAYLVLALLIGGGIAGAILIDPWIGAISAGALVPIVMLFTLRRKSMAYRTLIQEQIERAGAEVPDGWETELVQANLDQLIDGRNESESHRGRMEDRRRYQARRDQLEEDQQEMERERLELAAVTGIDASVTGLKLGDLAGRIRSWRSAKGAHERAESDRLALTGSRDSEMATLLEALEGLIQDSPGDGIGLSEAIERLRTASRQHREQSRLHDQAEREMKRLVGLIERRTGEIDALLSRTGTQDGNLDERARLLDRKLDALVTYRKLADRKLATEAQMAGVRSKLGERSDLLSIDRDDAEQQIAEASRTMESADELSREIGEIRGRIDDARKSSKREEALARLMDAESRLRDRAEEAMYAAAARFLLEDVDREHEDRTRPEVLRMATQYFAEFTQYRYELRPPGKKSGSDFRAIEKDSGRWLSLEELSDGTRVQLLLAARLAFATKAEGGSLLPIFLDEALSTADPERFAAAVKSFAVLAGQGRQIFYMTSNPGDVRLWQQIILEEGAPEPVLLDLAEFRKLGRGMLDEESAAVPHREPVPPPEGLAAEEYAARIGVPPIDPYGPLDSLHLFHLLRDDLELLHRLLDKGVETAGQWELLSRSIAWSRFVDEAGRERLAAKRELADATLRAWRIGRGRPIGREDLIVAGVVEGKIDAFADLIRELDGDAERFIACLKSRNDPRTTGYRSKKINEHESYFAENGFVDHRSVLSDGDVRVKALNDIAVHLDSDRISVDEANRMVEEILAPIRP